MEVMFNDEIMASLFPDTWKKSLSLVDAPTEALTSKPANRRPCEDRQGMPTLDADEKGSVTLSYGMQEQPPQREKPITLPFDFEAHFKAYEERRQKGEQTFKQIISALEGNEKACDYVRLYFASALVQWDTRKLKKYIMKNMKAWKERQSKYGEGNIANYSESIKTCEPILKVLDEMSVTKGYAHSAI